jgi:hypothetical protein
MAAATNSALAGAKCSQRADVQVMFGNGDDRARGQLDR